MLTADQSAPTFRTLNLANETVSLAEFSVRKNIALYFYPKDDIPDCTNEANQFTPLIDRFDTLDTVAIDVSKDDCDSHQQFIDKSDLKVELLTDTDGSLCEADGVLLKKQKNAVKKMSIVRSTYIINKVGMLADVEYGVMAQEMVELMATYCIFGTVIKNESDGGLGFRRLEPGIHHTATWHLWHLAQYPYSAKSGRNRLRHTLGVSNNTIRSGQIAG